MSRTQPNKLLKTFTFLISLTLMGCSGEFSLARQGEALSQREEGSLFKKILEDVGEFTMAGNCTQTSKAPPMRVVLGTKRPFWKEVQGHVLLETLSFKAYGPVKNDKFLIKAKGPGGKDIHYLGHFNNDLNKLTIRGQKCSYQYLFAKVN